MSTNQPPTTHAVHHNGQPSGMVQVFQVLPTQVLDAQDGQDLGTGTGETIVPAGGVSDNQQIGSFVIEFLGDRYAAYLDQGTADSTNKGGIYRRSNGGTSGDEWGRDLAWVGTPQSMTNFFVHHPGGVPTLAIIYSTSAGSAQRYASTTDGINWNDISITTGNVQLGNAVVWNSSVVWSHASVSGSHVTFYNPEANTITKMALPGISAPNGNNISLHVHDGVLYALHPVFGQWALSKLNGGIFSTVISSFGIGVDVDTQHAMFTDPYSNNTDGSKDLIIITNVVTNGARCLSISNPATTATVTDITTTVFGDGTSYDGGLGLNSDRYRDGGASIASQRRYSLIIDTRDILDLKAFLWTYVIGGPQIECWEWRGQNSELEAVNNLTGFSTYLALPSSSVSHALYSPTLIRVEIGDENYPPIDSIAGTRIYFRCYGIAADTGTEGIDGIITFYGNDKQVIPETIIPIVSGTLTIEEGIPPSTPTISGNTIVNFTPDDGMTLYSIILETDAAGVDIGEGEFGIIIGDIQ
jgi:hypothetical protein